MKTNSLKWLFVIVCILALLSFGLYKLFTPTPTPTPIMFTYEFTPDDSSAINKTMAIEQIEGIVYKIEPLESMVVSEPSPDWGIKMYFSEDAVNFLYFYASRSPAGYYPFPNDDQERNSIMINGIELDWGIFGDDVIGSYIIDYGYGIVIQMEVELWNANQETIINLIKSAKVY